MRSIFLYFLQTNIEQIHDNSTPPKPPPPVLPQKPCLRHSARKSLDLSPTEENPNISLPLKEIGRESISLNVSFVSEIFIHSIVLFSKYSDFVKLMLFCCKFPRGVSKILHFHSAIEKYSHSIYRSMIRRRLALVLV